MKNPYRLASGSIASVLLSLGLVRIAECFDTVKSTAKKGDKIKTLPPTANWACVPCDIARGAKPSSA